MPNFATIASNLHDLTAKNSKWNWQSSHEDSFKLLKDYIATAPVLAFPVIGKCFTIDTDASNTGIGGVCSQTIDGVEKVLGYYSRKLTKEEKNYCVTRKELLAVVDTVKHFHKYLYGQKFTVRTDHAALKWLINLKNAEGQLARWIEKLQS